MHKTYVNALCSIKHTNPFIIDDHAKNSILNQLYLYNNHMKRKRFGQHFLHDHKVLQDIVNAIAPTSSDHMVEIGPGRGVLTAELLPNVKQLDVIEIDRDLVAYLQNEFRSAKNFTIHEADILSFDFNLITRNNHLLRIVGNLPYNISTPLLFKLFPLFPIIQDMHFLLQKEVVVRLCAKVGSHHYGRLSVMSQYFCENMQLLAIKPNAFSPPPKVDSAFIRMIPHRQLLPVDNLETLSRVVKEAFNYRRKTLANCLKKIITSGELISIDIDPNQRPQQLIVEDFVKISNMVSRKYK